MNAPIAFDNEVLWLAGYPVRCGTVAGLAAHVLDALARGEQTALFFANTNFVVQCAELRERMRQPGVLIANDGIGMDIAARVVHGRPFVANLNGTDFVPHLLGLVRRPVYLVGARPGIVERAAARLHASGITVVGSCDGYCGVTGGAVLVEAINAAAAEIVLVALGNPRQEAWILEHRHALDARLLIGVGALFDFLAGDKPRAPQLVQRARMEWLYRLSLEPRRLLRRYTVDVAHFFALCLAHGGDVPPARRSGR